MATPCQSSSAEMAAILSVKGNLLICQGTSLNHLSTFKSVLVTLMQGVCKVGMAGTWPELVYQSDRDTTRIGSWGRRDSHSALGTNKHAAIEPEAQQFLPRRERQCLPSATLCWSRSAPITSEGKAWGLFALHPPSVSERWDCCDVM